MLIDSRILGVAGRMAKYDEATVKNEPMLFNCDMASAMRLGGPITRQFCRQLPIDWHEEPLVIDTRVHMLMPGWYPCIPGWHHDDVPRTRSDGQPNYGPGQDRSAHIVALVNGDIAPTEFAVGAAEFQEPDAGKVLYQEWHPRVERLLATGELRKMVARDRDMIMFDDRTWHTGVPAAAGGWRWFGRASRYFDRSGACIPRRNERTNELRRQVQVYLADPFKGW
jgi:hypothetical protein